MIPAYYTGRMSYVDIAWPAGLVAIGVNTFIYGTGNRLRKSIVSLQYVIAGLRMFLPAFKWIPKIKSELPRYLYQRRRWEKEGITNISLALQSEILV